MSDTILAIIELENEPEEVTRRAAWVARQYGCDLFLLLTDPSMAFLRDSFLVSNEAKEIAASIEEAQSAALEELAAIARNGGSLAVASDITRDRPAHEAIIARSLDIAPKFVIKGTEYHSTAERARFAYTDWQLIRKLDVPLWFVKPREWQDEPVVVAAVDPTHQHDKEGTLDQAIVSMGKELIDRCGGQLVLLHTYQRLIEIGSYAKLKFKPVRLPIDELDKKIRENHWQKLEALATVNRIPSNAVHQLPGRTRDILPTFARTHGADLVIMGALARSGLRQRTIGSTAEQVLDHLHCDVLIARSD